VTLSLAIEGVGRGDAMLVHAAIIHGGTTIHAIVWLLRHRVWVLLGFTHNVLLWSLIKL